MGCEGERVPFGLTLTTAPASEPVTLTEAKARLRETITDSDTDITDMIAQARAAAESECGRAFIAQTWTLTLDRWPRGRVIPIPRPPLQSVTYVKYYDGDAVQQTLSASNYYVATGSEPGRVVRKANVTWPTLEDGRPDAIEIRFVAGYASAAAVPKDIKRAILTIVAALMDDPAGAVEIPPAARRLLNGAEFGEVW